MEFKDPVNVIHNMVTVLNKICDLELHSDSSDQGVFELTCSHNITLRNFIKRVYKFSYTSDVILISSIILMDRLNMNSNISINRKTVHGIFAMSFLSAAKMYEDTTLTNLEFGNVFGIKLHNLNKMEISYLFNINFNLNIDPYEIKEYEKQLIKKHYSRPIFRRHSFHI